MSLASGFRLGTLHTWRMWRLARLPVRGRIDGPDPFLVTCAHGITCASGDRLSIGGFGGNAALSLTLPLSLLAALSSSPSSPGPLGRVIGVVASVGTAPAPDSLPLKVLLFRDFARANHLVVGHQVGATGGTTGAHLIPHGRIASEQERDFGGDAT